MSDSKSSYGDPVEEPTHTGDDVVGRAHEGLADAEAARREAEAPAFSETPVFTETAASEESGDLDPIYAQHAEPETIHPHGASAAEPVVVEPAAATVVAAPVVTPSEPVAEPASAEPASAEPASAEPAYVEPAYVEPAATTAFAPQPIFVQAPEQPHPRGNRGAAGGIGLLAALAFAVLYAGAWVVFGLVSGAVTVAQVPAFALGLLTTWSLWVPVIVFFIAFWLLGAIINRGRWGAWVIFGLLVGVASYGGHILGVLFQAPFWSLTASQGAALVTTELFAPLAIAALVIGRELTIWFGAWVAARGKRMTELNTEALREYERTLEAGPQLVRS